MCCQRVGLLHPLVALILDAIEKIAQTRICKNKVMSIKFESTVLRSWMRTRVRVALRKRGPRASQSRIADVIIAFVCRQVERLGGGRRHRWLVRIERQRQVAVAI